ncbi:MAG: hypothetical protein JXR56_03685 [Candidatus Cloacimonetes bacterium]|nr:hypothetical protein [Candidatus Cloacimonadota bacterium]
MKRLAIILLIILPLLLQAEEGNSYESSSYYEEISSHLPHSQDYFGAVNSYRITPSYNNLEELDRLRKNPFYLADLTRIFSQKLNETEDAKMLFLLDTIMQETQKFPRKYYQLQDIYRSRVSKPKDITDYVIYLYETVQLLYTTAFSKLKEDDMELLTRYVEQENYPAKSEVITFSQVKPILDRIDFANLFRAGFILHTGITVISRESGKLVYDNPKPIIVNSQYGKLIIGTTGNDTYTDDFTFLLEPAGNEIYTIQERPFNSFASMIDMSGNDLYQSTGRLFTSDFGIFCSLDLAGSDTYRAKRMFSSEFGYQFHYDVQGNDIYQSKTRSCGYAAFGVSVLQDGSGNDTYLSDRYSLGVGATGGCGVLFDVAGDDLYKSTGKTGVVSASQGFGYGSASVEGGIGVLYDKSGNDLYVINDFGQAAAINNGVGILIDEQGNDTFFGDSRVQGYAENSSFASLLNGTGNDKYNVSSSLDSSSSKKWSFVLKRDMEGDDSYCYPTNTLLSFKESAFYQFDFSGNDHYQTGRSDKGMYSIGAGMFLDGGGEDVYTAGFCINDTLQTRGYYCVIKDTLSTIAYSTDNQIVKSKSTIDTTPVSTIESLLTRSRNEALSHLVAIPDTTSGKWELVKRLSYDPDEATRYVLPDIFNKNNVNKSNLLILDALCNDTSFRVAAKAREIRDLIKKKKK